MYHVSINGTLAFEVESFAENFDINFNKTILSIRGENSIANNGLSSLSSLLQNIANQEVTSIQIQEEGNVVWESDLYKLENASLTMMKKEIPSEISGETRIKNYVVVNISFVYEVKEEE
jgi:hypothetical protein